MKPPVVLSADLKYVLRQMKLSSLLDILPERVALARQSRMPYQDFLEVVLADEVARRERVAHRNRGRRARLDPTMTLEAWDDDAPVGFDRELWAELCTLRFIADAHNVLIMGPVGVGKTHLASTLGHIAIRRKHRVLIVRADQMLKRLKAARLDQTYPLELRKLLRVELLIIDDFALQSLDQTETQDIYEIVVERHGVSSTIVTSNREPKEWLDVMADPMLAQSAIDRFQNAAYELVIEGGSYRTRQKPSHIREEVAPEEQPVV